MKRLSILDFGFWSERKSSHARVFAMTPIKHQTSNIKHPRLRRARGLSIAEMLVSLSITSLLLTATMVAIDASFKAYANAAESAAACNSVRTTIIDPTSIAKASIAIRQTINSAVRMIAEPRRANREGADAGTAFKRGHLIRRRTASQNRWFMGSTCDEGYLPPPPANAGSQGRARQLAAVWV